MCVQAACHLELKDYAMTIRRCTEVLAVDPHLVKALYRRARAHLESKDFGEAKRDVIRALDITPNDTQLRWVSQARQHGRGKTVKTSIIHPSIHLSLCFVCVRWMHPMQ